MPLKFCFIAPLSANRHADQTCRLVHMGNSVVNFWCGNFLFGHPWQSIYYEFLKMLEFCFQKIHCWLFTKVLFQLVYYNIYKRDSLQNINLFRGQCSFFHTSMFCLTNQEKTWEREREIESMPGYQREAGLIKGHLYCIHSSIGGSPTTHGFGTQRQSATSPGVIY